MKETHKLERLLHKTFIYKQEHITIKDYYAEGEKGLFKVITDKKPITVKESEIDSFVKMCLPVDEPSTKALSTEVVMQTSGLLGQLQQTLLDNIEKVKLDKDYIKQANVINSSVNSLIGMTKLQIQVAKMNSTKN